MEYDRITYYELDKGEKDRILSELKSTLSKNGIKLGYIFGSFLRRKKVRDIDIAIYAEPKLGFDQLLSLGATIELELGLPIDLLQLQDLDPRLKLKILAKSLPIIKNRLHHYLLARAYSEWVDFKICIRETKDR